MEKDYDQSPGDEPIVWVMMPRSLMPKRWQTRASNVSLVVLTGKEAQQLLRHGGTDIHLSPEEGQLARLVATGTSNEDIAREMHMTLRTVYRRLARLRKEFGVKTTAELAARLRAHRFDQP